MKIRLTAIFAKSSERPAGYVEAVAELRAIYRPPAPVTSPTGLGDLVAMVATPIARAMHLPCIDPATQDLRPESGCAKRRAALNKIPLGV